MSERNVTFYRWDDMPKEKVSETLDRRLITGDRMMISHVYLKKGSIVPRHSHENEQITYVLEGALHFWIGADEQEEVWRLACGLEEAPGETVFEHVVADVHAVLVRELDGARAVQ